MAGKRLSRFQTMTVYCFFTLVFASTLLFSLKIEANPAPAPAPPSAIAPGGYGGFPGYSGYPQDIYGNMCQSTLDHLDNIKSFCTSIGKEDDIKGCVFKNIGTCMKEKGSASSRILGPEDGDDDYGDSYESDCTRIGDIQRDCPGLYAVDPAEARRNAKDSRSMRDDLDKERKEARKDDRQNAKDAQKEMQDLDDEELKNDKQHRAEMKALTDRIRQLHSDKAKQQLEAFKAAQVQYDNIDKEYMAVRKEMRRKVSKTNEVELAWGVECRAAATAAANQAEVELDVRLAEEQKLVRNYKFTNASGQMRRLLKQKRKRIINKYNQILSQCMRGEIDPGTKIKMALKQGKNDVADSDQDSKEIGARLENIRKMTSDNMTALMKSLEDDVANQLVQIQGDMQNLNTDFQANTNRLKTRRQQAQQNQVMDMIMNMQNQKEMNGRLNEAMGDQALASAEYRCYQKMPQSQIDENLLDRSRALKGYSRLSSACRANSDGSYSLGTCDASRLGYDVNGICKGIKAARDANKEDSSSRRSGSRTSGPAPN